jgi:hypothetical protein
MHGARSSRADEARCRDSPASSPWDKQPQRAARPLTSARPVRAGRSFASAMGLQIPVLVLESKWRDRFPGDERRRYPSSSWEGCRWPLRRGSCRMGLWARVEPLLPTKKRRGRYPGPKRLPDRQALQGILIPLAWTVTGGVRDDITQLLPLLDRVPPVRGKVGRPRRRPERSPPTAPTTTSRNVVSYANAGSRRRSHVERPHTAGARSRPVDRRAHLRLAPSLQAAARPLRPPRRDPRSLPRHRLLPHLLPKTRPLIVIRVLKLKRAARSGNKPRRAAPSCYGLRTPSAYTGETTGAESGLFAGPFLWAGRIRTRGLGIKSPSRQAATNCT